MRYMGDGYKRKRYQIAALYTIKLYKSGVFRQVLALSLSEKAEFD